MQGIDDRRILIQVLHRKTREVDPLSRRGFQTLPVILHLAEYRGFLRIVRHGAHARPGKDQVTVQFWRHELGESFHHAERIFEAIPA